MNKKFIGSIFLFLLTFSFAILAQEKKNVVIEQVLKSQRYKLLFEDNFDRTGKPAAKDWLYRINAKYGGTSAASNVVQDKATDGSGHGCLIIKFTADTTVKSNHQFIGGGVVSTHNFGYGYYETRVKLYGGVESLSGLHQSFWSMGLTGTNEAEGKGIRDSLVSIDAFPLQNRVLEIDGFELNSKDNQLAQNHHVYTPNHIMRGPTPNHISRDLSKWIVMGYEWLPDRINYYCDGVLFATKELNGVWNNYAPQNFWLTALPVDLPYWGKLLVPPPGSAMQTDYFKFYAGKLIGVNRVGNSGFEYGEKASNTYPTAWIVSRTGENNPEAVKVQTDSTKAFRGKCFLIHKYNKPYKALTKQIIEYIPNGLYTFSAYVKSSGGQKKAALVVKSGGTEKVINISASNIWTKLTIEKFRVKENNAIIKIQSEADANQWLMVDDVEFKELK